MSTLPYTDPETHFKILHSLLLKGFTSQLLFSQQLPPTLKVPALISCRMYEEATIQLLKQQQLTNPLQLLWLVACSHMIDLDYEEYYQKLSKNEELKYKQIADDWIKMNKPLSHSLQIKSIHRKKFQQILQQSQEQCYFQQKKMPVFLVSCKWLEKFFNNNISYIPAIDNSDLYQPMKWVEADQSYMHYNYRIKDSCRENVDYKIVSYEAWQYLWSNFGGMEFRRFTTNERQPICQITYQTLRIMIIEDRFIAGFQVFQILVGRYDTIALVIERIKRILIQYQIIEFESLRLKWQPILFSRMTVQQLVDIVQDQERDILKQSKQNKFQLSRLDYNLDIEDSQYNNFTDILVFSLCKTGSVQKKSSFVDVHSISYKKTIKKKYDKCQTCNTTQKIQQCKCRQVYFCSKQCRNKNKDHLKICQNLMKQDSITEKLVQFYDVNKRKFDFTNISKGGNVGLQNLGNTCYMNAAIQCVLSISNLNQYFLSNSHIKQLNVTNVLGSGGHLTCAYAEFIKDYYTTNRRALEPIKILKIVSSKNSQFRGNNHQDSQEFFNYFLDKLHEDLNRVRDKPYIENIESDGRPDEIISQLSWRNYLKRNNSFISDNFAGQYRSEIRCPDCERISITFDPFLSVTLPFPTKPPTEEIVGYILTSEGSFQKVQIEVNANMSGQQFIKNYFHQQVEAIWLKKKLPQTFWNIKKSLKINNKGTGVLMFYPKAQNSTTQVQLKIDGYEIFYRKFFINNVETDSEQKLLNAIISNIKGPITRATKNDQVIKIPIEDFLKLMVQNKVVQIVDHNIKGYPLDQKNYKVKIRIIENNIPWKLCEKIKFDFSVKAYEYKNKIKPIRRISDEITIPQLLQSFNSPQQLTQQNSWYCNKCKDHKLAKKIMSIYKSSKYLVLHLKRFNHRGNRYVIYGEKVKTPIKLQYYQLINGIKYELIGVVNHYGSLMMGHYTAFVKRNNQWYYADDTSFRKREPEGSEAYLLFYKKSQ